MNQGTISTRYAKAMFQYALARGEEEHLRREMQTLSEQFTALPLMEKVLEDPTVSPLEKIRILHTSVGQTPSEAFRQSVRLVIENKRERYLRRIAWVYDTLCRKEKNKLLVKLTTAQPTDPDLQEALVGLIVKDRDQAVDFTAITDENLIGGFILELEDARLDASVKNQLNRLRVELIRN
ncbi:MAG: ATP synthase F1 subunit delta [Tannerellaceae bacterium]|jgi:F-type H+-transporting ATPase subunit delta|nr:ATP synthase F1 subunit delta [Tannerellaceae bacterium]